MLGPSRAEPAKDVVEVARVRRLDCVNARLCITTAIQNDWPAFACPHSCGSYEAPDAHQRALDLEGLMLLQMTVDGRLPR